MATFYLPDLATDSRYSRYGMAVENGIQVRLNIVRVGGLDARYWDLGVGWLERPNGSNRPFGKKQTERGNALRRELRRQMVAAMESAGWKKVPDGTTYLTQLYDLWESPSE